MDRAKLVFVFASIIVVICWASGRAQNLSLQEQRRLSRERFHQQWELLKATPAFEPSAFVAGVLRPLDPLSAPRVDRTVFGYYAGGGYQGIDFELLSHLALAFTDADSDGSIVSLPLSSYPGWYEAINAAHDQGVQVLLVVRNRDFDSGVLSRLLASEVSRRTLVENLLDEVELHSLDGVSVDFENVHPGDRDRLTLFMAELAGAFRGRSPEQHVSLAVPSYDWGGAFDLPALAEISDALLMMQYVYHGVGSGVAGPQGPIDRTSGLSILDSIQNEFLAAGVPGDKLVLLMPYYGYQWLVDASADASSPGARVSGLYRTVRIDENPFPNTIYDESIDRRGQYYHSLWTGSAWVQGWVDEASSIGKKSDLVQELDLQGVGMWRLEYGTGYPELWDEIASRFASDCPRRPLALANDRWALEIWDNRQMAGEPVERRYDASGSGGFDFNWGGGGPSDCAGTDDYAIRFRRRADFAVAATYRFTTVTDDGVRLFVDGERIIDDWRDMAPTERQGVKYLSAGWHELQMDYYENGGGAVARLSWEAQPSCGGAPVAGRWRGEYFLNQGLQGSPAVVRDDGDGFLNFDWGGGSPAASCGIGADDFSVRWTRTVALTSGTYRFTVTTDDGFRLSVDGVLREEAWWDQGPTTYRVDVPLDAGDHSIELEYYENGGGAVAKLSWAEVTEASPGWSYPVGAAESGAPWWVSLPLGESWYSDDDQRWYEGHLGEDWFRSGGGELGAPVYAAADGKVVTFLNNCGNWVDVVILEHDVEGFPEPMYSFYGHIEANGFVKEGDWIARRQQIGTLGDPVKFEPHLHFEIKNRTALINVPFSNCARPEEGLYIGAGYSGERDVYKGGDYYDPSNDGVSGNRHYHPSRFIEARKDGSPGTGPDCADFLEDVDYPDGTPVAPGETFEKRWRLLNCGDIPWSDSYRAVRIGGLYGPPDFTVPTVAPGDSGELAATFVAPISAGTHRATYQLEGPSGRFGDPFWVEIRVAASTDCARFLSDINVPDGTPVAPGATFDKGWRLHNCGDTDWSGGYRAVRIGGSYGPVSFALPFVARGQDGELWASFVAPTTAGTHRATYQLEGPAGRFGDPFWVEIRVVASTDCARFLSDINFPDGTRVSPGQSFDKGWRFSNCGNTTWTSAYRAVRVSGGYGPTTFAVPALAPETDGELWARFTAPTTTGTHRASYRLEGPGGLFGDLFWVEVRVAAPTVVVDDGDAGFQLFGPAAYWHREWIGYGGDMYWPYVHGSVVSNKVRWRPALSGSGSYRVEVFIPYNHATSRTARYTIRANGTSHSATVDQSIWYDQWVTLGTFFFHGANDGTEYVELTDATGEAGSTYRKIGFDAVRWVRR